MPRPQVTQQPPPRQALQDSRSQHCLSPAPTADLGSHVCLRPFGVSGLRVEVTPGTCWLLGLSNPGTCPGVGWSRAVLSGPAGPGAGAPWPARRDAGRRGRTRVPWAALRKGGREQLQPHGAAAAGGGGSWGARDRLPSALVPHCLRGKQAREPWVWSAQASAGPGLILLRLPP